MGPLLFRMPHHPHRDEWRVGGLILTVLLVVVWMAVRVVLFWKPVGYQTGPDAACAVSELLFVVVMG